MLASRMLNNVESEVLRGNPNSAGRLRRIDEIELLLEQGMRVIGLEMVGPAKLIPSNHVPDSQTRHLDSKVIE